MAMNHSVSELVCLIRNGQAVRKKKVVSSFSKVKEAILSILQKEGYIKDYRVLEEQSYNKLEIELAYKGGQAVIKDISIISKPGQRKYSALEDVPVVSDGLGMVILSTSKGILSDTEAKVANVGGELLLKIF
jgi:small subunit ribosomal protein S8